MAKGNRAPASHHTTANAKRPKELVHIGTTGPFPLSLGGSRCLVMLVDIESRLQQTYGTRNKIAEANLADMGVPRAFRSDNDMEYTYRTLVELF